MKSQFRHGSLFSGLGGFDLAAEWMGWRNIFHCEIDPFCSRVLKYHYPKAERHEDIRKTDFRRYRGKIDILSGGFPCQPFSIAGKRLGKADERHLWPDMLRAIREIRPQWVVAENVLGIVSWNQGMVFEEVYADLEAEGYTVQAYVLPAAGLNAPHNRQRVWFVANRDGLDRGRRHEGADQWQKSFGEGPAVRGNASPNAQKQYAANTEGPGSGGTVPELEETDGKQCQSQEFGKDGSEFRYDGSQRDDPDANGTGFQTAGTGKQPAGTCQPGMLDKDAAHTGNLGRNNGGNNRSERPVQGDQRPPQEDQQERQGWQRGPGQAGATAANTRLTGLEGKAGQRTQEGTGQTDRFQPGQPSWLGRAERWEHFPQAQPAVRIGNDGLPPKLDFGTVFNGIPFPVKPITFSKWRILSIKALGNAIVPQIAYYLFLSIQEYMKLNSGNLKSEQ